MSLIDELAEQKIAAALAAGEFDDLPGKGKPLVLHDDSMVPEHLRAGYRLLRNAGYVPPQMDWSRQLRDVESLVEQLQEDESGPARERQAEKRLRLLQARLKQEGARRRPAWVLEQDYRERVLRRFSRAEDDIDRMATGE